MSLVAGARDLYAEAYREGFAMPAFNVCNLEMAQGCLSAAEAESAPVILQTYPGDMKHGGEALAALLRSLIGGVSIPVILHLDHGQGLEMVARCLGWGSASVMFAGAALDLEENIERTRRIAEVAHAFSASTEGELGLFGGDHGSVRYTDPDEAGRYAAESGADTLAVSVGSEHHQQSRLALKILAALAARTGHPLVLHRPPRRRRRRPSCRPRGLRAPPAEPPRPEDSGGHRRPHGPPARPARGLGHPP